MKALLTLLVVAAIGMVALTVEIMRNQTNRVETLIISGVALCTFGLLIVLIIHFGRLA